MFMDRVFERTRSLRRNLTLSEVHPVEDRRGSIGIRFSFSLSLVSFIENQSRALVLPRRYTNALYATFMYLCKRHVNIYYYSPMLNALI